MRSLKKFFRKKIMAEMNWNTSFLHLYCKMILLFGNSLNSHAMAIIVVYCYLIWMTENNM
jgi:hypothetical protein